MRRQLIGLLFFTALAVPALAEDKPVTDDKLVGTWVAAAGVKDGKEEKIPDGFVVLVLSKDGKVIVKQKGEDDVQGTYKLTKTAGQIDVSMPDAKTKKTETAQGLYQIDGDSLKLGFPGKETDPRPASFEKAEKVVIFKRPKS